MIPAISPSQIKLFRDCPRKFAYTYFSGLPKESTKAQELGTKAHRRLELYLSGTPDFTPDPADPQSEAAIKILQAVIPYVPNPAIVPVQAETKVDLVYLGVRLAGRLDWVTADEVGDLKTVGTFRYMPEIATLRTDPQAVIYSLAHPGRGCHWLYAPTSGREPKPLRFQADMAGGLDAVMSDAYIIAELWRHRPKPATVEAKPSACNMYGGCQFRSICNVSKADQYFRKETDVSVEDFLKNLGKAPADVAPPAPAAAAPAADPVAPPTDPAPAPTPEPKKRQRRVSPPEAIPAPVPPEASAKPIRFLFVNCLPVKGGDYGQSVAFSELAARANREVSEEGKVGDYRCISYEGAGIMTRRMVQLLSELSDACLVIDTATPEGALVVNEAMALAANVVRGL